MKKYLIFAASALALASCSSDDFLGENPGTAQNATTAINFGGDAGKITRANTSNTAPTDAGKLAGQFKVFGVKKFNDGKFHNVFVNYSVWDNEDKNTTSNTNGWEYVGVKGAKELGTGKIELGTTQTIKYWDYSTSEYHFVAGSLIDNFTPDPLIVGKEITYATISGLAGHINFNEVGPALVTNPVYVAEPVIVPKANYNNPVTFHFVRQQSMVRVGFYETIPGYSVTEIKFYKAEETTATSENVILTSATPDYFVGGSNITGTVNYDWTKATPSYTFEYTDNDNLKKSKNWYAGKLGTLAETSLGTLTEPGTDPVAILYGTDKDMSDKGYFTVLPTPSATTANAIVIKCDYTLTSDDGSGETINVTGATAAIPAAFCKWETNTRYTYLFKISQDTNGNTGDPDKVGLYPITFDAVVTEATDKTQGTTTTVATPSITTYQEGSVTDKGIEYKPGKEIKVTVTNADGTEQTLTAGGTAVGSVAVFKFDSAINEAEIQVKGIADATAITENVNVAGNVFTFTPTAEGYYAIQYKTAATPDAYTYKVVHVTPAP